MRYAARLFALVIAALLGCLFFGDVWVLIALHRLDIENGHPLPPTIHMQDLIAVGAIGLAFISFCLLFRFLGRKRETTASPEASRRAGTKPP